MTTGKGNTSTRRGRTGPGRKKQGTTLDVKAAKARVIELRAAGYTVEAAMKDVDRSVKTYEYWRRNDEAFKANVDLARSTRQIDNSSRDENRRKALDMGFEAWRQKYLNIPTYWHQRQWIQLLEGEEPEDLHPAQTYIAANPGLILINTPVFHAKSTTITVDYVTYRVCTNPNVRIAIISKNQTKAKEFLGAVKDRLTKPAFAGLIKDFAPEGGFKEDAETWAADRFYVGEDRDSGDPNPTVQALGLGGQIYGARLDLIVLDDCITGENVNEWEKQLAWLNKEVSTRPGPDGLILVVGTRLMPHDLYGQLLNPENFGEDESPWTYLAQPAILEEKTEESDGKVLWPYATIPWATGDTKFSFCKVCRYYERKTGEKKDCANETIEIDGVTHWPRWDRFHLEWGPKRKLSNREWQLVFQQQAIPEDSTFPEYAVRAAVNKRRASGLTGGLDNIPDGCYWILSMDPATTGAIGAIVYAVDPKTMMRYVAQAANPSRQTPAQLKSLIKRWCVEFPSIREVVVENTGLNTYFTQDAELRSWIAARGIRFTPHQTGGNKWDPSWGVGSMSTLFGAWDKDEKGMRYIEGTRRVEFPRLEHPALNNLVKQLLVWTPELDPKKTPCDLVMALWFAECAALRILKPGSRTTGTHQKSRWLSPNLRSKQGTIRLAEADNRMIA